VAIRGSANWGGWGLEHGGGVGKTVKVQSQFCLNNYISDHHVVAHGRMARGGYGQPKVSPGPAMPYCFTLCRQAAGRGDPPAGQAACGCVLPLWTPYTVRPCVEQRRSRGTALVCLMTVSAFFTTSSLRFTSFVFAPNFCLFESNLTRMIYHMWMRLDQGRGFQEPVCFDRKKSGTNFSPASETRVWRHEPG
jgi:hypothetical protein